MLKLPKNAKTDGNLESPLLPNPFGFVVQSSERISTCQKRIQYENEEMVWVERIVEQQTLKRILCNISVWIPSLMAY